MKTKLYSKQIDSTDKIQRIPSLNQRYYDKYSNCLYHPEAYPGEYFQASILDFGEKLSKAAKSLTKEQQTIKFYVIIKTTPNRHAIAVAVTKKKDRYIVKIYDPNQTCRHSRYIFSDAEMIADIIKSPDFIREITHTYSSVINNPFEDNTFEFYNFDDVNLNGHKSLKALIFHYDYLSNSDNIVIDKRDWRYYLDQLGQMKDEPNYWQICGKILSGIGESKLTGTEKYNLLSGRDWNNANPFNYNNQIEELISESPELLIEYLDATLDVDECSTTQQVTLLQGHQDEHNQYRSIYQRILTNKNADFFRVYLQTILPDNQLPLWGKICLFALAANDYPTTGKTKYQDFVAIVKTCTNLSKDQQDCLIALCSTKNIDDIVVDDDHCQFLKTENDSLIKEIKALLTPNNQHMQWCEKILDRISSNEQNLSLAKTHFLLQELYRQVVWSHDVCQALDYLDKKISELYQVLPTQPGKNNQRMKIQDELTTIKQQLIRIKEAKIVATSNQSHDTCPIFDNIANTNILNQQQDISSKLGNLSSDLSNYYHTTINELFTTTSSLLFNMKICSDDRSNSSLATKETELEELEKRYKEDNKYNSLPDATRVDYIKKIKQINDWANKTSLLMGETMIDDAFSASDHELTQYKTNIEKIAHYGIDLVDQQTYGDIKNTIKETEQQLEKIKNACLLLNRQTTIWNLSRTLNSDKEKIANIVKKLAEINQTITTCLDNYHNERLSYDKFSTMLAFTPRENSSNNIVDKDAVIKYCLQKKSKVAFDKKSSIFMLFKSTNNVGKHEKVLNDIWRCLAKDDWETNLITGKTTTIIDWDKEREIKKRMPANATKIAEILNSKEPPVIIITEINTLAKQAAKSSKDNTKLYQQIVDLTSATDEVKQEMSLSSSSAFDL